MARPHSGTARVVRVIVVVVVALLGAAMLAGCGDDQEVTAEEQALLDDDRYGEETFEAADLGGEIPIDDRRLVMSPSDANGEEGTLAVTYNGEPPESRNVDVHVGSVFAIGEYRIRVVTVGETSIAIEWAKLEA